MGVFRKVKSKVKNIDKIVEEIKMAGVSEDAVETYTKLKKAIKKGTKSRKEITEDKENEEKKLAKQIEKIATIKEAMANLEEKAGKASFIKLSRLNFFGKDAKKYRNLKKKLKIAKDKQALHKDMVKMLDKKLKRKENEIKLNEKDLRKCKKSIRKIWNQSAEEIKAMKDNKAEQNKKTEVKNKSKKEKKGKKEKEKENKGKTEKENENPFKGGPFIQNKIKTDYITIKFSSKGINLDYKQTALYVGLLMEGKKPEEIIEIIKKQEKVSKEIEIKGEEKITEMIKNFDPNKKMDCKDGADSCALGIARRYAKAKEKEKEQKAVEEKEQQKDQEEQDEGAR